jgi:hypothetical protein
MFVEKNKENRGIKQGCWCEKMRLACEQVKTNKLHQPNFSTLIAASQNHE